MTRTPARVALVGAAGYGAHHLREIGRLAAAGLVELVALCDPRPLSDVPSGVEVFTDHRAMLARLRPDVDVISTPPHTHLPIALDLLAAGADLLLEKPPVPTLADHDTLAAALAATGRVAQIGFQAQGSHALANLRAALAAGRLGTVTGIAAGGTWIRDDAYYARSPWAGRRLVDGEYVLDGTLVNPFAHALMLALSLAEVVCPGTTPTGAVLERYRCRDIEVDDTACLRVTFDAGPPILAAATLCAERFRQGDVILHGTTGSAVLEYPTDRLAFVPVGVAGPGAASTAEPAGRTDPLENLLAHRADPQRVALQSPLSATRTFTALAEAIVRAAPPVAVAESAVTSRGTGGARTVTLTGVDAAVTAALTGLSTFVESGQAWADPTHQRELALS